MLFLEMFTYPFMVRALIAGALITLCASLLGVSLVLKRYSMIGVGLSYVGFGSLSLAVVLKISPVQFSMPIVIIAALLLLRTNKDSSIKPDALIAMVSCISLSFGVMVTAMTTGLNIDVCTYLFGSILAMKKFDVYMSILLSVIVICVYLYYYKKIFLITFDEEFASAKGENKNYFNGIIAVLTAITVVLGMRLMGTMLISSLIIFPALTSMRVFKNYSSVLISSVIIGLVSFIFGMYLSYAKSLPSGGSIVFINFVFFIIFFIIGKTIRSKG